MGWVTARLPAAARGDPPGRSCPKHWVQTGHWSLPSSAGELHRSHRERERNTVLGPALKFLNISYLNKLSENKLESENSSQKLYGEL